MGDQTANSRAGALYFNTTPPGNPGNSLIRFIMNENGQLVAYKGGSINEPMITIKDAEKTGLIMASDKIGYAINGTSSMTVSIPAKPTQTSMTLVIKDANGAIQEKNVVVGEANSCGKGYRCLRIAN